MHYKAAWACGQAALRLAHMPTRRYDHHRLSPLVSTRNDEGPLRYRHEMRRMIDRAVQLLERGELTWKAVAQWFEAYRVPFEVTCRVLAPYAKK